MFLNYTHFSEPSPSPPKFHTPRQSNVTTWETDSSLPSHRTSITGLFRNIKAFIKATQLEADKRTDSLEKFSSKKFTFNSKDD